MKNVISGLLLMIATTALFAQKATIEWVSIPAGTFKMGSPLKEDYEPQYNVTLSAFSISKYEITNAQYAAFLNAKNIGIDGIYAAGAYPMQVLIYSSSDSKDWGLHFTNSQWVPVAEYENTPVISVTWYGAAEYATYIGGTLPTEKQWEYACRAGTITPFNTGTCLSNLQANYRWDWFLENNCTNSVTSSPRKPQPVGSYAPNGYGLCDMHGNVSEWCSDIYGTYRNEALIGLPSDASSSPRVIRGGDWDAPAGRCSSFYRSYSSPYDDLTTVGFRVVLNNP